MSQIPLSNPERAQALQRFGYSEREAQFLVLAALHGGFFVRAQYCRFIGRQIGGTAAELVRKLLDNGHATAVAGCQNTKVYHLGARPFYAALGQEDNRNRRDRPPVVIKNKLMCLDFVLDHPRVRYLATEQEKIAYFHESLRIPLEQLPSKLFRSPTNEKATTRYFVDKYPVFVSDAPSSPPVVSFCFVDEGLVTPSHFQSYLCQYNPLFRQLPASRLIYVAASQAPFRAARRLFEDEFGAPQQSVAIDINNDARKRLFSYFEARQLYEAQQFETFDRDKLIQLRDDRQAFGGVVYEALYRLWTAEGATAVERAFTASSYAGSRGEASFETVLLPYNYSFFGRVSRISFCMDRQRSSTAVEKETVGNSNAAAVARNVLK